MFLGKKEGQKGGKVGKKGLSFNTNGLVPPFLLFPMLAKERYFYLQFISFFWKKVFASSIY